MKSILFAALTLGLATAAAAGTSDRYDDLRLDTGKPHMTQTQAQSDTGKAVRPASLSSRNISVQVGAYAYSNPHGVGPYNDSR